MASRNSGTCDYNGLLNQELVGTVGGDSYYACGFLSNYTRASTCCASEAVHEFPDPCYSWCDLPASMNNQIDNDRDFSMLDYMSSCLNQTGETIGPLWCRLTQPHVNILPKTTTTDTATPTPTQSHEEYCEEQDRQSAISVQDPWAACGILSSNPNHLAFEACCQPAPAQWARRKCFEWCYLPRGNIFRGFRDSRNLTDDQILGSFKTCMIQEVGDEARAFDGLWCRANESAIDLGAMTFQTAEYLMEGRMETGSSPSIASPGAWMMALPLLLSLFTPHLRKRAWR
jgi:hypothetical protein